MTVARAAVKAGEFCKRDVDALFLGSPTERSPSSWIANKHIRAELQRRVPIHGPMQQVEKDFLRQRKRERAGEGDRRGQTLDGQMAYRHPQATFGEEEQLFAFEACNSQR
jgi:hypothetical protein